MKEFPQAGGGETIWMFRLWKLSGGYSCDNKTVHEVRFMSELNFTGKLLVCTMCGETVREPMIGSAGVVG